MKELHYYLMNITIYSDDKATNGVKSDSETATHVSSTRFDLFMCLCSFCIYLLQNIS